LPRVFALAGSVVFLGSAVVVNRYRRRAEASAEAVATETMDANA